MRVEIGDIELTNVNGGSYHIYNNHAIRFDNVKGVYMLKVDDYTAMAAMDNLIGRFDTVEEYDNACFEMLKNNGWLR